MFRSPFGPISSRPGIMCSARRTLLQYKSASHEFKIRAMRGGYRNPVHISRYLCAQSDIARIICACQRFALEKRLIPHGILFVGFPLYFVLSADITLVGCIRIGFHHISDLTGTKIHFQYNHNNTIFNAKRSVYRKLLI